jgi:hypothetical protein
LYRELAAYAVLAVAALLTLSDPRFLAVPLIVLASLALRAWMRARASASDDSAGN